MQKKLFLFLFLSLLSLTVYSEEPKESSYWDHTCDIAKGAGQCVWGVVDLFCVEPVRSIHDTCVAGYFMATGDKEGAREWVLKGEAWSDFSKAFQARRLQNLDVPFLEYTADSLVSAVQTIPSMGKTIVMMPWDMMEAWNNGDYEKVGNLGTNILSIVVPAAWGLRNVTINFSPSAFKFIPTSTGKGQFALAAVATRAMTIEGVSINEGTVVGVLMASIDPSGYRYPGHYFDPKLPHFSYENLHSDITREELKTGTLALKDTDVLIKDVPGKGETLAAYRAKNVIVKGVVLDNNTHQVIGYFEIEREQYLQIVKERIDYINAERAAGNLNVPKASMDKW